MIRLKIAILGSRSINSINLEDYVTEAVSEVISGGAEGIDTLA